MQTSSKPVMQYVFFETANKLFKLLSMSVLTQPTSLDMEQASCQHYICEHKLGLCQLSSFSSTNCIYVKSAASCCEWDPATQLSRPRLRPRH